MKKEIINFCAELRAPISAEELFLLKNGSLREQRQILMALVSGAALDGDFVFPAQKSNLEEIRVHVVE